MSTLRVHVDPDLCVGHGRCYALAPAVYDADQYGYCIITETHVPPGYEAQARTGALNCPEDAITITEE